MSKNVIASESCFKGKIGEKIIDLFLMQIKLFVFQHKTQISGKI